MKEKRSLYMCQNTKVLGERIRCAEGHPLSGMSSGGTISVLRLARGEPLELTICQSCRDYKKMGPPVAPEGRGWAQLIGLKPTKRRGRPRKGANYGRRTTSDKRI